MDFQFSEEHLTYRKMAYDFAQHKLASNAVRCGEQCYFPIDSLRQTARLDN